MSNCVVRGYYWPLTVVHSKRRAAKGQILSKSTKWQFQSIILTPARIVRSITYLQLSPSSCPSWLRVPPLGTVLLLLAYFGFVLALEFINDNVEGAQFWEARGIRAGWLAVAQTPLIILLVGKVNWIGLLTGVSYERLNVLHRWAARIMLLLAIFHFAFQARAWSEFPGIFRLEWTTDLCVPTGLAAFILLVWMNISTLAPIRNLWYELFVVQHILTFFGLIVAIMMHLPPTALYTRVYVYIPVGLYIFDRLVRTARYVYINRRASRATLTRLPGGVTRVHTRCANIKSWKPGSHVLVSIPALGLGQNHPATIACSPQSQAGDIVFLLKGHTGFTKTILGKAKESNVEEAKEGGGQKSEESYRILLDGPYGGQHADFAAFDTICLVAGSTGITFVLSILLGAVHSARTMKGRLPLRQVHVVWAVKESSHLDWVRADLDAAVAELQNYGMEASVSFFVTADYTPAALQHVQRGRPSLDQTVESVVAAANGECGVAVCGPFSMNMSVRNAVAGLTLGRSSGGNTASRDVYLHVEGFAS